jgi:hypothetical protein
MGGWMRVVALQQRRRDTPLTIKISILLCALLLFIVGARVSVTFFSIFFHPKREGMRPTHRRRTDLFALLTRAVRERSVYVAGGAFDVGF